MYTIFYIIVIIIIVSTTIIISVTFTTIMIIIIVIVTTNLLTKRNDGDSYGNYLLFSLRSHKLLNLYYNVWVSSWFYFLPRDRRARPRWAIQDISYKERTLNQVSI